MTELTITEAFIAGLATGLAIGAIISIIITLSDRGGTFGR